MFHPRLAFSAEGRSKRPKRPHFRSAGVTPPILPFCLGNIAKVCNVSLSIVCLYGKGISITDILSNNEISHLYMTIAFTKKHCLGHNLAQMQAYFFNTYAVETASVVAGKTSFWVLELSFEFFKMSFWVWRSSFRMFHWLLKRKGIDVFIFL